METEAQTAVAEQGTSPNPVIEGTLPPATPPDTGVSTGHAEASAPTGDGSQQPAADAGAPAEGSAPAEAAPPEAAPVAPEIPKKAWSFQVDRNAVEIPGTHVREDGVIEGLTVETFRQAVLPRIGDRTAWHTREQALKREIARLSDENRPEIIQANKAFDRLVAILEMDDVVARDAELDKLRADIPTIMADAEKDAVVQERDHYKSQMDEIERREVIRETIPVLQTGLVDYIKSAMEHESLKNSGLDVKVLEEALWNSFGTQGLFEVGKEGDPDLTLQTRAGPARIRTEAIDRFLLAQASVVGSVKSEAQRRIDELERKSREAAAAAEVARKNAAALAPDTSVSPVVRVQGGASIGEPTPPWKDPNLTREQQREAWEKHMRDQGLGALI